MTHPLCLITGRSTHSLSNFNAHTLQQNGDADPEGKSLREANCMLLTSQRDATDWVNANRRF